MKRARKAASSSGRARSPPNGRKQTSAPTKSFEGASLSVSSAGPTLVKSADSASLWNFTLSPGWTRAETEVLRLAIMKFGLGKWKEILEANCLPGKTRSQLSLQTQRMMGRQSLAEFKGIHMDPRLVFQESIKRTDVQRKAGLIINTGNNPTKEELLAKRRKNMAKYGLSPEEIEAIQLPTLSEVVHTNESSKHHLNNNRKQYQRKNSKHSSVGGEEEGEELKMKRAELAMWRLRLEELQQELDRREEGTGEEINKKANHQRKVTKAPAASSSTSSSSSPVSSSASSSSEEEQEEEMHMSTNGTEQRKPVLRVRFTLNGNDVNNISKKRGQDENEEQEAEEENEQIDMENEQREAEEEEESASSEDSDSDFEPVVKKPQRRGMPPPKRQRR
ncbi:UBA domain-containing protein [Balamuthia mandrillaris]